MRFSQVIMFCLGYASLNVIGTSLIKKELASFTLEKVSDYVAFLFKVNVILAFVVILFSSLIMFKALSMGKFSVIVPLATGISFSLTVLVGNMLFGDKITFIHVAGLMLILSGIIVMSFAEKV